MARKVWFISAVVMVLVLAGGQKCESSRGEDFGDRVRAYPAKNLASYAFDPQSSLISRVSVVPDFLLSYLNDSDGTDTYSGYTPSRTEMAMIDTYIGLLPPLNQQILAERCIGLYFVENFYGSGMADYILDDQDNVYLIIVFNPDTLKRSMSEWMTYRENSCFIGGETEIALDCGDEYTGFMYVLVHESTHAVDYVQPITPYVESGMQYLDQESSTSDFIKGAWDDINEKADPAVSEAFEDVTFYGMNDGPKIPSSKARSMYEDLMRSPFVSLYGSLSWSEDLAEYVTWYHWTSVLNQPYRITVSSASNGEVVFEPMDSEAVRERSKRIMVFY